MLPGGTEANPNKSPKTSASRALFAFLIYAIFPEMSVRLEARGEPVAAEGDAADTFLAPLDPKTMFLFFTLGEEFLGLPRASLLGEDAPVTDD